jgi:hypothetical protein
LKIEKKKKKKINTLQEISVAHLATFCAKMTSNSSLGPIAEDEGLTWTEKLSQSVSDAIPNGFFARPDCFKFEQLSREFKDILEFDVVDGLSLEFNKAAFFYPERGDKQLVYHFKYALGSTVFPQGSNFEFASTLVFNERNQVYIQFGSVGSFFGYGAFPITKNFTASLKLNESPSQFGTQSGMSVMLDYQLRDAWANLTLSNRLLGVSYVQNVSKTLSAGVSFNGGDSSAVIGSLRHEDTKNVAFVTAQTMNDSNSYKDFYYNFGVGRKVSPHFTLVTGMHLLPSQLRSVFQAGFKYSPNQNSNYRANIDGDGKISALWEQVVSVDKVPLRLSFCAEMNHIKNEYRTGFGVGLG